MTFICILSLSALLPFLYHLDAIFWPSSVKSTFGYKNWMYKYNTIPYNIYNNIICLMLIIIIRRFFFKLLFNLLLLILVNIENGLVLLSIDNQSYKITASRKIYSITITIQYLFCKILNFLFIYVIISYRYIYNYFPSSTTT